MKKYQANEIYNFNNNSYYYTTKEYIDNNESKIKYCLYGTQNYSFFELNKKENYFLIKIFYSYESLEKYLDNLLKNDNIYNKYM